MFVLFSHEITNEPCGSSKLENTDKKNYGYWLKKTVMLRWTPQRLKKIKNCRKQNTEDKTNNKLLGKEDTQSNKATWTVNM